MQPGRQSTGVKGLDALLGGGLLPGKLTVIVGATGIGKTQLGLQYCQAGESQDGCRGAILDVAARGDSQSHHQYAQRMFDWTLQSMSPGHSFDSQSFFDSPSNSDYLHLFDYQGRRVTRQDLAWDDWRDWQAQLNAKLQTGIAFLYGGFVRGVRRVVVDGVEPAARSHESIQLNLFEYVYHQILRKEAEWVARDLFRENYRRCAEQVQQNLYDHEQIGCLLLYTSHEVMLDELITRPLEEGDSLSNANTLIYMGKVRQGDRLSRALYIAKHRGSACDERIVPFEIDDRGLQV